MFNVNILRFMQNTYFIVLIRYLKNYYWGLGIGDWGLGPIPNPQSPIPTTSNIILLLNFKLKFLIL